MTVKYEITSPCVRICKLITHNEQEFCVGCGRTRTDITNWRRMTDDEKQDCIALSNNRLGKNINIQAKKK